MQLPAQDAPTLQHVSQESVPPLPPDTLDHLVRLLVEESNPLRIILSGSYALGNQTSDSDIDLVVVLPVLHNRLQEMVRLRRALAPIKMPIDVLVYSADEVREKGNWTGTALNDALKDGWTLYGS